MHTSWKPLPAAALLVVFGLAGAARAQDTTPEVQAVDALNAVFGKHPGIRANHSKGTMLEGSFTAAPGAASLTRAGFLQPGVTTPVTVRFSDSTGLPDIPDGAPGANPHGLAMRFHQADGTDVDFVINSLKFFPVSNVSEFRDLLLALAASPPSAPHPTKFDQFTAAHPKVKPAFGTVATPASLALENYQGIDAFILTNKAGQKHAVRFDVLPPSGIVVHLDPADAAKLPPDYLMDEIVSRVRQGPVRFHLRAQVAEASDPTRDPSLAWPDSRAQIDLGTLTLTHPVADSREVEKTIVFMPTNLTDGIEPSDDPLIQSRTAAYAESFARRQP